MIACDVSPVAMFDTQVEDENYTAELLYAADKYEFDQLVMNFQKINGPNLVVR